LNMRHSQSQMNLLLVLVAILAVAGGLAVVIVTSPQSWQAGPATWIQTLIATPTPFPTPVPPTATPTDVPATATLVPTAHPTGQAITITLAPTETETPAPAVTPSETPEALPTDVTALAVVVVQSAGSARVRNQPGGDTVVAAVPSGTQVQVLGGRVEFNNVVWLQVRVAGGQIGWIADFLLRITKTLS
jgi:cytoskeletal protein RodZ